MAWNGLPRGLPLKCYFWGPGTIAASRKLKAAGYISGSPCLDRDPPQGETNMMIARNLAGLGLIPDWQFNMDPSKNPKVVNLDFPAGMYQTTTQPVGPYMNGDGLSGLGNGWMSSPGIRVVAAPSSGRCPAGSVETSRGCVQRGVCPPGTVATSHGCIGGGGLAGLSGFDTFLAAHRLPIAIGALTVLGAAMIVAISKWG